jgi:hypothetical protein
MNEFEYKCDGLIIREINEAAKRDVMAQPLTQVELRELQAEVDLISARHRRNLVIATLLAVVLLVAWIGILMTGYLDIGLAPVLATITLFGLSVVLLSVQMERLNQAVCDAWKKAGLGFNGLALERCSDGSDEGGVGLLQPAKPGEIIKLAEIVRDPGMLGTGVGLFLTTIKQEREITSLEVHLCIALSEVWGKREEYRVACADIAHAIQRS